MDEPWSQRGENTHNSWSDPGGHWHVGGVAVMAAFWLGTVPALVAAGLGAQLLAAPLRRHVPAVTAVLLVALGIFAIVSRPTSVARAVAAREQTSVTAIPAPNGNHACCDE